MAFASLVMLVAFYFRRRLWLLSQRVRRLPDALDAARGRLEAAPGETQSLRREGDGEWSESQAEWSETPIAPRGSRGVELAAGISTAAAAAIAWQSSEPAASGGRDAGASGADVDGSADGWGHDLEAAGAWDEEDGWGDDGGWGDDAAAGDAGDAGNAADAGDAGDAGDADDADDDGLQDPL